MKAVTWQGKRDVRVIEVPDPAIVEPTDAIIKVTSAAICGSDLHLYEVLGPYLKEGDVLGHETMGVVTEVGSEVGDLAVGDRVVIPFNISCGSCFMCTRGLQSQCETTQVRAQNKGATLFGYTSLYGSVPGGQAEYLRVPQAQYGPVKIGPDGPDERFLFLSDILPTAWQAVAYADPPEGGTVGDPRAGAGRAVRGPHRQALGTKGDRGRHGPGAQGARRATWHRGDRTGSDDVAEVLRDLTDGRGPDAVIDAVGMEAHGAPVAKTAQSLAGLLPDVVARKVIEKAGVDSLVALHTAIDAVRRGGTVSLSGVYGGAIDPMPMMDLFDKQIQLRMGQCNVRRWVDELLPLVNDPADPLGVLDLVTHTVPIDEAPRMYEVFQKKQDGCIKVVLKP